MVKFKNPGMSGETREELEHVLRIVNAIGGLTKAKQWLQERLEYSTEEPPLENKMPWIKWYREVHHCSIKDAHAEWMSRKNAI